MLRAGFFCPDPRPERSNLLSAIIVVSRLVVGLAWTLMLENTYAVPRRGRPIPLII